MKTKILYTFLSQMLPLNAHQRSVLFPNRKSLPFSDPSHGLSLKTITNALTRALQSADKHNNNIQCYQLKFLQSSQHKQILFLNFLVFTLFCPPAVCPETVARWDMGDVRVISATDTVRGSHAFQHNFQPIVAQRCALQSHDRHSLLVAVIPVSHWSALNEPKPLGVPTAKSPEDWGQEIVQASWLDLRVLSTVHRKSSLGGVWQCGENEVMPHHAWTTCVVADEEAHVPRVLLHHSPVT
jgi:hypothetical protein